MAKVKRKALERGKKLVKEHVFDPLAAAVTDLNGVDIALEQLDAQWAPFRINWSIPYIAADMASTAHSIPFALPPLQDSMAFTTTSRAYTDTPGNALTTVKVEADTKANAVEIFLDEVTFGFDQRDAPAAISNQFSSGATRMSADQGKLCFDRITDYDIGLSIQEKDPIFFVPPADRTAEHEMLRREVWSVNLDHTAFANDVFALNPFVVGDINEQIDPWKTYVFTISAPKVGIPRAPADGEQAALVSIEVSLKFRAKLMKRNVGTWAPDNAPTSALTRRSRTAAGNAVSLPLPADGAKITADETGGVNVSIAAVDEVLRAKLYAGFNKNSEAGSTLESISEEIEPDAAYEVLTVPLFQNNTMGGVSQGVAFQQPYGHEPATNVGSTVLIDRRIIPISYPFQIEHVIVGMNFQRFGSGAYVGDEHPGFNAPGLFYDFGVGVGTGAQADDFDYNQIAGGSGFRFQPGGTGTLLTRFVIDKIRSGPERFLPKASATTQRENLELRCLPLAGTPAHPAYYFDDATATNLQLQGAPWFVGRAASPTATRTRPLANVAGKEQWIEVRGKISAIPSAGAAADALLVGYQGFFVYIIGRKFLVS